MCRTFQARLPQQGLLGAFPQNGVSAQAKATYLAGSSATSALNSASTTQPRQNLSLPYTSAHGPASILPSMDFSAFPKAEQNLLQPKRKFEVVGLLGDAYQMHNAGKYMLVPCDQVAFQPKQEAEFIDPEANSSSMPDVAHVDTHRASCHRCGNMRKKNELCTRCPQTFCARCAEKMRDEHGPNIFSNGCPVCKGLCCCGKNKSVACMHKYHCYKKCPCTKKPSKSSVLYGPSPADIPVDLNPSYHPEPSQADPVNEKRTFEDFDDTPLPVMKSDYPLNMSSTRSYHLPPQPYAYQGASLYSPTAETNTSDEDVSDDSSHFRQDSKRRKLDDDYSVAAMQSANPAVPDAADEELIALLSDEAFVAALDEFGEFFASEGV